VISDRWGDLLQRVDAEKLLAGRDRLLGGARFHLTPEELRHRGHRGLPETLACGRQPLVECAGLDGETVEQVPAVKRRGPRELVVRVPGGEPLEREHVDVHGVRLEPDDGRIAGDVVRGRAPQRRADREERLAQAVTRLLVGRVTPEQRGESLARVSLAGRQCEKRQQRLSLLEGQDDRAGAHRRLESVEEDEVEARHRILARVAATITRR
jgi:hypothetical protein